MEYSKEILVKDYFDIHNHYSNIYGINRTIILMQVGSFHEAYCTNDDGIDLPDLALKLDICCTYKNSNLPLSKSNPRMLGFPIYVTTKYIDKLIDLNYTIVLIDQITDPPNPKRKVTNIYSPGTFIETKSSGYNYVTSIVIDTIKDKITNKLEFYIGISCYELSLGNGYFYETYSKSSDPYLALDNIIRFLEIYPSIEIIIYCNIDTIPINMDYDDIFKYLNIHKENVYTMKLVYHNKISWQKNLLHKIYKPNTNIDIIEYLGLNYLNLARLSLIFLLDYIIAHRQNLLNNIQIPTLFECNKYLYLGNKAIQQLDIIQTSNENKSLFNIINFTVTPMGKRYLLNQLIMPLIDSNELNNRYNIISTFINNNHCNNIKFYLNNIHDLDKLNRKLDIKLNPYELYNIYLSFIQIDNLQEYLKNNNLLNIFNINNDYLLNISLIKEWIETRFIIDKLSGLNFINYNETDFSIYKKTVYPELDELQNNIDTIQNFMQYLIKILETYIVDPKKSQDNNHDKSLITLKYNDRDGYHLLLTSKRYNILKKNLDKIEYINIGTIKLFIADLEFINLPKSPNTKINCKKIKEYSLELMQYKITLAKNIKEYFKNDIINFANNFKIYLTQWSNIIAYIDFLNSGALCAIKNHYSKPIINNKEHSYFKAKELRHPIVEKINKNYIPNDIELGYNTDQYGILLYGINSAGKSTLMKSIGLNIVLVQIGYYSCSTEFEFSPYNNLFVRINGNDNIHKGLSSFMIEMIELMAILKRNNLNTLVIADELCRGTEEKSANIIIIYMLELLSKNNTSFITATHIHKLLNFDSIKNLKNIKIKHLKILYDDINDKFIYERNLLDGEGELFYGLQIAKCMMKDANFNLRTSELLNEYENIHNKISKYNNQLYLNNCEICKTHYNLETHHIIFQKDFNKYGINESKFYLQKNSFNNLVVLCSKCHDKIDNNIIYINGWKETSDSRILDFIINDQHNIKKNRKYDDNIINYINNIKIDCNNDLRIAQLKIKNAINKKISTNTIENIWNNNYN